MATLTIIRGVHGSATKQVGDILEKCTGACHIHTKNLTALEMRSKVNFVKFRLERGMDVIVSGSLLTRDSVMLFVKIAVECGAGVGIIKPEIMENLDKRDRDRRKKEIEEFEAVTL